MSELRRRMDREAEQVRADPRALDQMLHRAEQRRRTRRIATGAVALAVAGGSLGLAYAAFRPDPQAGPAGPVAGPTPSPPNVIPGLVISNGSSTEGAAEFAAALLVGEAVVPDVVVVSPAATHGAVTTIHCHPTREAEASSIRDEFFPGAELRPRIDPDTILVTLGGDFVRNNRTMFQQFMTVRSFMTRRIEGSGAEALLSEDAARAYAEETGGLDLYSYTKGGRFDVTAIYRVPGGSSIAAVRILGPSRNTSETLTVGDPEPQDGEPKILAALVEAPIIIGPAFDDVRPFVEGFLEARRRRSGAGTYLGEDARAAYAAHEAGLDLLGYATGPDLVDAQIVQYDKLSPARHRVGVRFVIAGPDTPAVWETLLIGWDGEVFVVLDAERGRPE
jgi:hypothetical protein